MDMIFPKHPPRHLAMIEYAKSRGVVITHEEGESLRKRVAETPIPIAGSAWEIANLRLQILDRMIDELKPLPAKGRP